MELYWNIITTGEANSSNGTQPSSVNAKWLENRIIERKLTQVLHRCVDIAYGARITRGGPRRARRLGHGSAIRSGRLDGLALVTPYCRQAGHKGCVVLKTGWGPSVKNNMCISIFVQSGKHKCLQRQKDIEGISIDGIKFSVVEDCCNRCVCVCGWMCVVVLGIRGCLCASLKLWVSGKNYMWQVRGKL